VSEPAEFRFASHRVGTDIWVISLSGDCGDDAGADLERQLTSIPRNGSAKAVVDLTAATSVRSSLLVRLVASARQGRKDGLATTVVSDDRAVRKALGEAEQEGSLRLERLLASGIREALSGEPGGMNDVLAEAPFRLHIERRAEGEFLVVATGEADLHAAPELDRCIRECEESGPNVIVVDLAGATLLDSIALGVLVAAHGRLAKRGIPLKLVFTNHLVRRVLTITGLDRVFDIYPSSAAALEGQKP
jgi:anti-anti-sigma factor